MTDHPKASVIMGIYNCEETLQEAIESILAQTYDNWELIMCDDGSIDQTYDVAKRYQERYPQKIKLLRNDRNMKLAFALNRCLAEASGELVARMDADDRSCPERLQRQVCFLLGRPDIQLVGTAMRPFDANGFHQIMRPHPNPNKQLLVRGAPFFHATIMTYKHVYDALGGYSIEKRAERVEDVDLWFRFYAHGFVGANIDEPLYEVREDLSAIRRRTLSARIHSIQTRAVGYKLLGFPLRRLIKPAFVLFIKGLTPPCVTSFVKTIRTKSQRNNIVNPPRKTISDQSTK